MWSSPCYLVCEGLVRSRNGDGGDGKVFVSIVVKKSSVKGRSPNWKEIGSTRSSSQDEGQQVASRESNVQHQRRSRWESHVVVLQIVALLHLRQWEGRINNKLPSDTRTEIKTGLVSPVQIPPRPLTPPTVLLPYYESHLRVQHTHSSTQPLTKMA